MWGGGKSKFSKIKRERLRRAPYLTSAQFSVLKLLVACPEGYTFTTLVKHLGVSRETLNCSLKDLKEYKFIRKESGRYTPYKITDKGLFALRTVVVESDEGECSIKSPIRDETIPSNSIKTEVDGVYGFPIARGDVTGTLVITPGSPLPPSYDPFKWNAGSLVLILAPSILESSSGRVLISW